MKKLEWKSMNRYDSWYKDSSDRFTINRMHTTYELWDNERNVPIGYYDSLQKAKDVASTLPSV